VDERNACASYQYSPSSNPLRVSWVCFRFVSKNGVAQFDPTEQHRFPPGFPVSSCPNYELMRSGLDFLGDKLLYNLKNYPV